MTSVSFATPMYAVHTFISFFFGPVRKSISLPVKAGTPEGGSRGRGPVVGLGISEESQAGVSDEKCGESL